MKSRLFIRLLGVWLLASLLSATWAAINVFLGLTPLWLDAVFGVALIVTLMRWTAELAVWLAKQRIGRWVSWTLSGLAVLVGVLWTSLSFVSVTTRSSLNSIFSLLQPLELLEQPLIEALRAYQTGPELSPATLTQLTLSSLVFGLAALAAAIAGRVVWISIQPALTPRLEAWQVRLSIRPGRWLARLRWGLLAGLLLISVAGGLAAFANTRIAVAQWQSITTGPDTPTDIIVLLSNDQKGTLYAGTPGDGVFRSDDGGLTWQSTGVGLTDTEVWALVLDNQKDILYAGTVGGGVFRSDDEGKTWQPASDGLTDTDVRTLVLDDQGSVLYAGTDGGGVFRSDDGGATWRSAGEGLTNTNVLTLILDEQGSIFYAGTRGGGVFRSDDGGATWRSISIGLTGTDVWALVWDDENGVLYAGTNGDGVFRSDDGGATWQPVSNGLTGTVVLALVLDDRDGVLYAGAFGGGVFRSENGGATWHPTNDELTDTYVRTLMLDDRDGTLYAGTFGSGTFRSNDGGATWQSAKADLIDTNVRVLVLNDRDGILYAGTRYGGVFRSDDGGTTWQSANVGLTDTDVVTLMLDDQDNILYAGTSDGGVFRSDDGGATWQSASNGLTDTYLEELVLDDQDGILYAGTRGGVFRSNDRGTTWQSANNGLTNNMNAALVLDNRTGILYAGTYVGGVFLSDDGGATWQSASNGLTNTNVWALMLDNRHNILYAGTGGAEVFRSDDGGATWQSLSTGLADADAVVTSFGLDNRAGTLYVGTRGGGIFRSDDGGATWQSISIGLTDIDVWALAWDDQNGILYAGTGRGGVFYSADRGATWHTGRIRLTDSFAPTLILDNRTDILYAGTRGGGIFRSADGGKTWQPASIGLTDTDIRALVLDNQDSILYAGTRGGAVFRSADGGATWHANSAIFSIGELFDLFSSQRNYGIIQNGPGGAPVWATYGGNMAWIHLVTRLDLRLAAINPLPTGKFELSTIHEATLTQAELQTGHQKVPLAWLACRILAWQIVSSIEPYLLWMLAGLAVGGTLYLAFIYLPFGLPLWMIKLTRLPAAYARPVVLENVWPSWEQAIRAELLRYGDAVPVDLLSIPSIFRRYALKRYAQICAATQALEVRPNRLRLLTGDRLQRWQIAWRVASREIGTQPGLTPAVQRPVDNMANILTETLGLIPGPARDFEAVRAYLVEAPVLRLKLPPRFPLIFVADPQPGDHTVQMLVDAVDVLRDRGYFALVVPLEPPVRQVDIVAELRQAIARSPHVQDFIVLSQDDVLDILIARQPTQALTALILSQVDLTVVAPFVVSGPVPETMFFGREAEVKTLVEGAHTTNFAIVGNRKVGKTSLLRRALTRLTADKRVRPLWIDCQTVRSAADFFATFQAQTGLKLPEATPEGFRTAMTGLNQKGPLPVLLIDEVDMLLADEKTQGEPLAAMWRALAQVDTCHFIFCGSTGLARRLDDPHSVFFNFPQPLPLGYLSPETARLVLTQPLVETLGIILEDEEALLTEALALTSGHPNFIQYLGRGLIEAANRRRERRILLEDLVALRASTDFTEYYLKTVWGEAGALEKLITLAAPSGGFRLSELETTLAAHKVQVSEEAIDSALKMLQIYSILKKHERFYTFVPRAFPEILHRTQEVERLITLEKRRLAKEKT